MYRDCRTVDDIFACTNKSHDKQSKDQKHDLELKSEQRLNIMEALGRKYRPCPFKQPETRPISHDKLSIEVKGIYAGLVLIKAKCIEDDEKQTALAREENEVQLTRDEQWQSLVALYRQLLNEHHNFFLGSQHPLVNPNLHRLATTYSMPARMWRYDIHAFFEVSRRRLPKSLEHMLVFIYLAYSMMAVLYQTVPTCEDTWIECFGDLGRYRMAIEDEKPRDREVWSGITRYWYSKASDRTPTVGRLYHHLAILARPFTLEQLSYYTRALTCETPFASARGSIMTLFNPALTAREGAFTIGQLSYYTRALLCVYPEKLSFEDESILEQIWDSASNRSTILRSNCFEDFDSTTRTDQARFLLHRAYTSALSGTTPFDLAKECITTPLDAAFNGRWILQGANLPGHCIITANDIADQHSSGIRNSHNHTLEDTVLSRPGNTKRAPEKFQGSLDFDSARRIGANSSNFISSLSSKFNNPLKLVLNLLISTLECMRNLLRSQNHANTNVSDLIDTIYARIWVFDSKDQGVVQPHSFRSTAKKYTPLRRLSLHFSPGGISTFSGVACHWILLSSCFWDLVACVPLPTNKVAISGSQSASSKTSLWADSAVLLLSLVVLGAAQMLVALKRSPVTIWSTLMAAYAFAWWSMRSDENASLILNSGIFFLWTVSSLLYARSAFENLQAPSYTPLIVVGMAVTFDILVVGYMTPNDGVISQADLLNLSLPSASTALSATAIGLSTYRYKYGESVRTEDRILPQDVP